MYIFLSCEQSMSIYLSDHVKRTFENHRKSEYKRFHPTKIKLPLLNQILPINTTMLKSDSIQT